MSASQTTSTNGSPADSQEILALAFTFFPGKPPDRAPRSLPEQPANPGVSGDETRAGRTESGRNRRKDFHETVDRRRPRRLRIRRARRAGPGLETGTRPQARGPRAGEAPGEDRREARPHAAA